MTNARRNAVCAGITAANDDHVLAFGTDEVVSQRIAVHGLLRVGGEEFHGKVNAAGVAVGNW